MNKQKLLKLSLITLIIGVIVLFLAYFCFHFVTDEGITFVWHAEAGKPFVTILIGVFGVLFMWTSAMSLILALVFCNDKK
ncbi:MAG: hypothetical protein E7377_03235 [Clostridiales bacterium]|nr:hypothetical protein [Clostridiales bacterium]